MRRLVTIIICLVLLTLGFILNLVALTTNHWWKNEHFHRGLWVTCKHATLICPPIDNIPNSLLNGGNKNDTSNKDNGYQGISTRHFLSTKLLRRIRILSICSSSCCIMTIVFLAKIFFWIKRDKSVVLATWLKLMVITLNLLTCIVAVLVIYYSANYHENLSLQYSWLIYVFYSLLVLFALPLTCSSLLCKFTPEPDLSANYQHYYADSEERHPYTTDMDLKTQDYTRNTPKLEKDDKTKLKRIDLNREDDNEHIISATSSDDD